MVAGQVLAFIVGIFGLAVLIAIFQQDDDQEDF